jgi:hypothetical protein
MLKQAVVWGFRFVESFCWIKKGMDNRIVTQPGFFFNKSKTTCLIFRIGDTIDMRHQRSPDCEFDFIKPGGGEGGLETKPEFMYDVIETLLPTAGWDEENRECGGMLEMYVLGLIGRWAEKGAKRKGWTSVHVLCEGVDNKCV